MLIQLIDRQIVIIKALIHNQIQGLLEIQVTQDSRFSQSRQSQNKPQSQYSRLQKELQDDLTKAYPKTNTNKQRS